MLINEQSELNKRDDTLEARRIFNMNTQRMKYLQDNTTLFEYTK